VEAIARPMNPEWSTWFAALPPVAGLLAAGLRSPDHQTCLSRAWVEGLPEAALVNAWRCADDTFRVMRLHRFPTRQLRWTYAQAVLRAVRRDDGYLLLMLTETAAAIEEEPVLCSWIDSFLTGLGS
jgi:hypothetical protein